MPVRYYVDEGLDLMVARAGGAITADELIESLNRVVEETDGAALYKNHVFVMDDTTSLHDLDWDGLMRVKDNFEVWGEKYPGRAVKTALVASDSTRNAIAKMWQALTEAYPAVGSSVSIFRDEATAIAWLKS
jgi:hypothetical protein